MEAHKTLQEDLVKAMYQKKDELIKKAVSYAMGHDRWVPEEVKDRGQFIIQPDGLEVFTFDGVPLIEFESAKFSLKHSEISTKLYGGIIHRVLYEEIE